MLHHAEGRETVCNMRKRDMWDIFDCGHRSKHHKAGASVHVTKRQHTTETFTSTSSAIGNLASSAGHVIRMPSFLHSQVGAQQQCDAITLIQHNTRHIHNIVHVIIAIVNWQEVVVLPVVEKPQTLNAVSLSPNLSIPGHHHVYKYRCIKAKILDGNCAAGIIIMKRAEKVTRSPRLAKHMS